MRYVVLILVAVLNAAAPVALVPATLDNAAPWTVRVFAGATSLMFATISLLAILACFARLPYYAQFAVRAACVGIPVACFVGSLDLGIISGLEVGMLIVVCVFSVGNWYAFKRCAPQA